MLVVDHGDVVQVLDVLLKQHLLLLEPVPQLFFTTVVSDVILSEHGQWMSQHHKKQRPRRREHGLQEPVHNQQLT